MSSRQRSSYRQHSSYRQRFRGVTLIELMVVITIIVILLGVAVPLIKPALGDRKLREASRQVAMFLELAKSRAAETGRAHGVIFHRDAGSADTTNTSSPDTNLNGVHCFQMSLAAAPRPFSGDDGALVSIVTSGGNTIASFNTDTSSTAGAANSQLPLFIERSFIKAGDSIRINYRGPLYRITGISPLPTGNPPRYSTMSPPTTIDLAIALPTGSGASLPPVSGTSYPYQIIRQPVASIGSPQELPTGIVIDTMHSGFSSGTLQQLGPQFGGSTSRLGNLAPWPSNSSTGQSDSSNVQIAIMFDPDGRVETVYSAYHVIGTVAPNERWVIRGEVPLSPVHLLIGRQNQTMYDAASATATDVAANNLQDPSTLWVTVNQLTGRISTSENAAFGGGLSIDAQRRAARTFARSAITSGGN